MAAENLMAEPPEDEPEREPERVAGEIVSPIDASPAGPGAPYGYGRNGKPRGRGGCTARAKSTGHVCTRPAEAFADVCRYHGGAAPQVIAASRRRMLDATGDAADTLIALLGSLNPEVARRAAVDIMRLAGMEPGRPLPEASPADELAPADDEQTAALEQGAREWLERRLSHERARLPELDAPEHNGEGER